jgi:polysaccharide biosynthesis/export protein
VAGRSFSVLVVLVFFNIAAPAQQTGRPNEAAPPPAPEKVEAPKVPTSVAPETTGLPIDPKTYVIGPEDIINVKVWRDPDFSGVKGVRPDGKITIPLVGDVQAAGLTPDRLAAQLKTAISEYIRQPDVEVEVMQVNSKSYNVSGEVNRPGRFPLVVEKHVFQAVNDAGGFRDFGNEKDVVIIRADGTRLHFNYKDFVKHGESKKNLNVLLQNGDTVLVK